MQLGTGYALFRRNKRHNVNIKERLFRIVKAAFNNVCQILIFIAARDVYKHKSI